MVYDEHVHLTPRERDVAALLLEGLSICEIAGRLRRSTETVRVHVKHQHLKTDTRNLHSLALWAKAHYECCVDAGEDELLAGQVDRYAGVR